MNRWAIFLSLFFFLFIKNQLFSGQIFSSTDKNGNLILSDQPITEEQKEEFKNRKNAKVISNLSTPLEEKGEATQEVEGDPENIENPDYIQTQGSQENLPLSKFPENDTQPNDLIQTSITDSNEPESQEDPTRLTQAKADLQEIVARYKTWNTDTGLLHYSEELIKFCKNHKNYCFLAFKEQFSAVSSLKHYYKQDPSWLFGKTINMISECMLFGKYDEDQIHKFLVFLFESYIEIWGTFCWPYFKLENGGFSLELCKKNIAILTPMVERVLNLNESSRYSLPEEEKRIKKMKARAQEFIDLLR